MYGDHSHGGHDGIYLYRCVCYVWLSFSWWTWWYISVQMCMLCMAIILMVDMTVYICTDVDIMYGCHSHDGHDGIYLYRCACYGWLSFSWWTWRYISVQMCMLCMAIILMVDMTVYISYRCRCHGCLSFSWWTWWYISVQMCMLCMAVILMMDMTVYICTDVYVMYGCHSHDGHDGIYLYRCVCYVWLSFSWWKWWYISVQMCMLCMAAILMMDMTVYICTDVYVMYGCHSHDGHDGIYLYRCVCYVCLPFSW